MPPFLIKEWSNFWLIVLHTNLYLEVISLNTMPVVLVNKVIENLASTYTVLTNQRSGPDVTATLNMLIQIPTCMLKGNKIIACTKLYYFPTGSFHNKLKTVYLNGKVNRRIDYLLDALLRIEKDNFFKYMRLKSQFDINQKAVMENNRHHQGQKIPIDMVEVQSYIGHNVFLTYAMIQAVDMQCWRVLSLSGSNADGYIVTQLADICKVCNDASLTVCLQQECGFLCRHMYKCDTNCYDYNNGHICKHVHRVHSILAQSKNIETEKAIEAQEADSSEEEMDYMSYADPIQNHQTGLIFIAMCAHYPVHIDQCRLQFSIHHCQKVSG